VANSHSVHSSENGLISLSFLKNIFTGYRILGWHNSFLSGLKKWCAAFYGLNGLWWEIHCHSNCFSSIGKALFPSYCFQIFFFVSFLRSLTMRCLAMDCFGFTLFWIQLLESVGLCLAIISSNTFQLHPPSPLHLGP